MRKLTEDEILSCSRGALRAVETEKGLHLARFTHAAFAFYDAIEGKRIRAHSPAGAALDFLTDSDSVFVSARIGEAARQVSYFDAMVDGALAGTLGSEKPGDRIEGAIPIPPSGGRAVRRVALYLPHVRVIGLDSVALSDGASFEPAPRRPVMLALGDSITQGMDGHHPALTYPAVAARQLGLDLHNCGVGGAVYAVDSIPDRPLEGPALITVAFGTNDWNGNIPVGDAHPYLARLREHYPCTPIAVLSPPWRDKEAGPEPARDKSGKTFEDYRRGLAEIVAGFPDIAWVPRERLLPAHAAFLQDGTHPNTLGHVVYGMNVAAAVRKLVGA